MDLPKLDTWIRQETGVRDINAIRKEKQDGQVTLHGYLITVGPSEQQSGSQEIGPENRVVLDGETISPDSLDPYGQD